MTAHRDLAAIVHAALEQEAEAMTIDTPSAGDRLNRELETRRRNPAAIAGLAAAAVIALLALAFWSPWSPTGAQPAGPGPASSPSATIDAQWPYELNLATGAVTEVPRTWLPEGYEFGTTLAFSPDGKRVAVGACLLEPRGCDGESTLSVVSVDTGARTPVALPPGGGVSASTWAPDGRRLVYQLSEFPLGIGELYVYDTATGRSTRITDIPIESATWWSLTWSVTSDGTVLHDRPTTDLGSAGWNVWQVPIGGGPATIRIRDARAPEAMPDGRIAFVVPREGTWEGSALAIAERDGSRRTLATAVSGIGRVVSSPDARRLAYTDGVRSWVIDLATGEKRDVAAGAAVQWVDEETLLILP
jgi:dipeptidyl aminopeptidase/acylaminoacyl peptidase